MFEFLRKQLSPEKFGYEKVDAIHYYTNKLIRYNNEVCSCIYMQLQYTIQCIYILCIQVRELQKKYNMLAAQADENLQKKFETRSDTRVAAIFENIGGFTVLHPLNMLCM
jgi:hypothetical protein